MFIVAKSFFSQILSKFNIKTIAPLCDIHIPGNKVLLQIIRNIPLQQTFIKFVHFQESGQTIRCQHCTQTFHDMKSLQIHNFLDHHIPESPTPPLVHQSRNSPVSSFTNERNPSPDYHSPGLSCHICGMNVPNQTAFQQVIFEKISNFEILIHSYFSTCKHTRHSGRTSAITATPDSPA